MVHLSRSLRFLNNPTVKKFYYGLSGYNKYGLYRNDFFDYTDPVHIEAMRRLPADKYDQHVYRVIRAFQLEITKRYLPENEWITYEEDQEKGHFLEPYIEEVLKEKKEKEDWISFLSKD
ncbi:Cytochrome b-c1 complex subunit 7 [Sarcoptes scabiei]|uniref:Cytochrome b-c1 complex subunit 7 n=1 Tax=Sarcoptes scabiei TaxID=52283 RepID=A0A132A7I2_SARSC|nr:Cytochrome b-c1 complex subunit 7 [Sarcoptes scabiei]KPM06595.1 Sar s 24 allergen (cytochrome b-c1 complex subunit 7-like protein) [Sarcoptes scabiei]UXI21132.1 ultraspiracle [Sarcoptes scabiei]